MRGFSFKEPHFGVCAQPFTKRSGYGVPYAQLFQEPYFAIYAQLFTKRTGCGVRYAQLFKTVPSVEDCKSMLRALSGNRVWLWFAVLASLVLVAVSVVATGGRDLSAASPGSFDTKYGLGTDGRYGRAIWSNGETLWLVILGGQVRAFNLNDMSRDPDKDLLGISGSGNKNANGMWSSGNVMYLTDDKDRRMYAYSMLADNYGDRLATNEFRPHSYNSAPKGIWSDGTHVWIADANDARIYVYDMDGNRQRSMDIVNLGDSGNANPNAIWSNGHTVWVGDNEDRKIYAYRISDGSHQPELDYDTLSAAGNVSPKGLWSDGTYMYVFDNVTKEVFRYHAHDAAAAITSLSLVSGTESVDIGTFHSSYFQLDARVKRSISEVTVEYEATSGAAVTIDPPDADNIETGHQVALGLPSGSYDADTEITLTLTSNGTTKTYSIVVTRVDVDEISSDATLSAFSTSGIDFGTFDSAETSYEVDVGNDVSMTTVSVTPSDAGARYMITPEDADTVETGHQVELVIGLTRIAVEVAASDGGTVNTYYVVINRPAIVGTPVYSGFNELDAPANALRAIWSDGTTLWATIIGGEIRAFDLATMARRSGKDIIGVSAAGNENINGLWSDGDVMAASDNVDGKIYVYDVSTRRRLSNLEFSLSGSNDHGKGLWSDGDTLWVVDHGDDKVYAYYWRGNNHGDRRPGKDFNLGAKNGRGAGLWSDGATIWVSDDEDGAVYAYSLASTRLGTRQSLLDLIDLGDHGNTSAKGVWSDGSAMLVSDEADNGIYTYTVPTALTLSSLSLSDIDIGMFDAEQSSYTANIGSDGASSTTVTAVATDSSNVGVSISPGDADTVTSGHQVSIQTGSQTIEITVTDNTNSALTRTYRVIVVKLAPANLSNDAELSALSLGSDVDFGTFDAAVTEYEAVVPASVSQVTVAPTTSDANAITMITPTDADTGATGHQVDLGFGTNRISVNVDSTDGTADKTYVVAVTRAVILSELQLLDQSGNSLTMTEFSPTVRNYQAFAGSSVTSVTLNAAAPGTGNTVTYSKTDENTVDSGIQFSMTPQLNRVTVTITWTDGTDTESADYMLRIFRSSADAFRREYTREIDGIEAHGNNLARGIWSDGTTLWIVQDNSDDEHNASKLFAYVISTGARDATKDIELPDANVGSPRDIWADGTDIYVTDAVEDKVHAYNLSTKQAVTSKDVNLRPDIRYNASPWGIWSDSSIVWVVDNSTGYILARNAADNVRIPDRDIEKVVDGEDFATHAVWGDGATLWALGTTGNALEYGIYAFDLVTGERREDLDFTGVYNFGIRSPRGIWSDGSTMYVSDTDKNMVFAFNMPDNTDLSSLTVKNGSVDVNIGVFSAGTETYEAEVANSVSSVTVAATASDSNSTVTFSVADAQGTVDDHQVTLSVGENTFTILVANGDFMRVYTVTITRLSS